MATTPASEAHPTPAAPPRPEEGLCFHCGEPLPPGPPRRVTIDGRSRAMCCPGCEAVALLIADAGLDAFYRFRERPSSRPQDTADDGWGAYDAPERQRRFVRSLPDGTREATLTLEGMRCAACGWLIEHALEREVAVESVQVNPATGRALLRWHGDRQPLSELLRRLAALGYRARPLGDGQRLPAAVRERRAALKRLAVAGFGMMQVMTFALALYLDTTHTMETLYREFLRGVSLLVTTPVVFYAGWPFLVGAWRDLRARRPGMDVPVALAVGIAYAASAWNTFTGQGEVYFDSATMFIFFLSVARFLEMSARHRAAEAGEAVAGMLPDTVRRLDDGTPVGITLDEVAVGDVLRVAAGETVPADATVVRGESDLDESLLTGEPLPRRRGPGAAVLAGSVNVTAPVDVRVDHVGPDTVVSGIARLLHRAQAERPPAALLADRVAGVFVTAVLLLAALVAGVWWQFDHQRAFEVTLAVLVVSCPCALSLATPTALVAATTALARRGLLVTRARALESLTRIRRVVLDKTGTLTAGRLELRRTVPVGRLNREDCLAVAAALEAHSAHPIARAFQRHRDGRQAGSLRNPAGCGVEGVVDGRRYRLGRPGWAVEARPPECGDGTWIVLADDRGALAWFELADSLRADADESVRRLDRLGMQVEIASGDGSRAVAAVARALGVAEYRGGQSPDDKLQRVRDLQARGWRVAVVGDGVNDAPVLAGADVSVALASGPALAQGSADMVLLNGRLASLEDAFETGRRTREVIRQNLTWALAYNALAIPVAASGLLAPWAAALGMSASSLLVVANSLRLGRHRPAPAPGPAPALGRVGDPEALR